MASSTTTTTTAAACNRGLLKGLGTKLHACASLLRNQFFFPASTASLAIALLVCGTALSRVVVFFLPLVDSTTICCAAVCLLVASESSEGGTTAKEVVLLCGGIAEVGLLEVYGGVNASAYGDRRDVQVGCFLHRRLANAGGGWTKRGVDENGDEVVFAGRVAIGSGVQDGAVLEEELVALQVDRLAEGVWDSYFGGCSRWNYVTAEFEEVDRSFESS